MTLLSPPLKIFLVLSFIFSSFITYSSTHALETKRGTIIVVSPVSNSPTENGAELVRVYQKLLNSLSSKRSRFLLKLQPGIYDIGSESISLPGSIDLEGSGENVTLVRGNTEGILGFPTGVVTALNGSNVRLLSVENYNNEDFADSAALALNDGGSAYFVTAISTGQSPASKAFAVGGWEDKQSTATNITAKSKTRAVHISGPGLTVNNLFAQGPEEAVFVSGSTLTVRNSQLISEGASLISTAFSQSINLINTQIVGQVFCGGENCRCLGSYDSDLTPVSKTCTTTE